MMGEGLGQGTTTRTPGSIKSIFEVHGQEFIYSSAEK